MTTTARTVRTCGYVSADPGGTRSNGVGRYRYRRIAGSLRPAEVVILLFLLAMLLASAVASRHPVGEPVAATTGVYVAPGQTLWAIARQHPVDGLSTAQVADLIAQLNDLDGGSLLAGAVIRVPAKHSSNAALASR